MDRYLQNLGAEYSALKLSKQTTFAAVPSPRLQPELAAEWLPCVLSDEYDPRFILADTDFSAIIERLRPKVFLEQ